MMTTPDPVRIGVLGAGWFASRRHLPEIQKRPDATLAALCRRDPEARATLAAHFEVEESRTYADWEEMLEQAELDAVLIATPNALHYPQAKAALERGLHVLLEKPMSVRSAEAHELVALALAKNIQLAVALNPPYWAHCHRLRSLLKAGELGALEAVSLHFSGSAEYAFGRAPRPENLPGIVPPTMYRADPELNGGGYFIDGGSHLISELLWVSGLRARRVAAVMDTTPTDMRAILSIELAEGVMATVNTMGDSKSKSRRVQHLFGATDGEITVSGFDFDTRVLRHGQEPEQFREADLTPVSSPVGNFIAAIQSRESLFSPGEHGAQVVEVVEAAYESARTGHTITLPSGE